MRLWHHRNPDGTMPMRDNPHRDAAALMFNVPITQVTRDQCAAAAATAHYLLRNRRRFERRFT